MKKLYWIFLLFIVLGSSAQSQFDTKFLQHLVNKGNYNEALFLINQTNFRNDSLYFFEGWSLYSLKELDKSSQSLLKVSQNSSFYNKAQFFAAYNSTYLSDYTTSTTILSHLNLERTALRQLRTFQLSGIDLLNHKFDEAETSLETLNGNPVLYQPILDLKNISADMRNHKVKSPLVAGILSAIIPGSGKFYAGKKGQGIASFISTVGLGFITLENYRKLGPKHYKTIAFGTLFTANYVSTIYGSVVTTKQIENDYQTVMQNQILFNLHIPLRNFFE